jgi:Flp pilus assembly protein TadB
VGGVSGRVLLAAVAGGGVGVGVLLVVAGWLGWPAAVGGRWSAGVLRRLALALVAGMLVAVVTRWVAVSIAVTVLVFFYDRLFGGTRRARVAVDRLDALASWTESLRDMVASGVALPEALPASVAAAAPVIRPALAGFVDRLAGREPVESALRALADEWDDGGADLVIAALVLNARAQGRALEGVLSALSISIRAEVRVRRTVAAERRSTRRAVQVVVAVTAITALGLAVGNPGYVAPYRTVAGQLVLAVVVGVFAVGFGWLSRLSALPPARRILAPSIGVQQ